MSLSGGPSPAEQHLGDRLAALVDGELGHDARERVLAHLATCGKCKAEADAQRRLKSVFAEAAPPGPSAGFLARLQQLPGGDSDGPGSRLGNGSFGRGEFARGGSPFRYVPSGNHSGPAMPAVPPQSRPRGFRAQEAERPAQRRRFAFAAAGAVSLAAFALGGALPLEAAVDPGGGRPEGGGTAVTPLSVSPAADSGSLLRSGEFLRTGNARQRTWPSSGGPTLAPAPSALALYGPGAASVPSAPATDQPAGRFGLSPLIAASGAPAHRNPPPLPPLEPKRPLIGSAAAGSASPDTAAARR
ncbi:zf-HC2 domain-containing protein [Streptomyces sp. NPDC048506]|uniref:zf-HC2 domain-containing protein n=1 Tax=Streptomyces sp. NPDC048506 TaxID=3155028 RepID=UPI0034411BC4